MKFPQKHHVKVDEEIVIKLLIENTDTYGKPDLRVFYNVIYEPIDHSEFKRTYKGFHIAQNIYRNEMGFSDDSKPGDFDVIIIPFTEDKLLFERTAAFEVKVVRPTKANPRRNANSFGQTQALGLVQDGFPLVGLLHICMTEPLANHEKLPITVYVDADNIEPDLYDWFSLESADKQMKRMLATDLPRYVGINAYSLDIYPNGIGIGSCSQELWNYTKGYFNPHKKLETIDKVKKHYENHSNKYVTKYLDKIN